MGAVDEAIQASVISPDNPWVPGIPGWVTLQSMGISQEGQIGRLWVFVSPKANCPLEVSCKLPRPHSGRLYLRYYHHLVT